MKIIRPKNPYQDKSSHHERWQIRWGILIFWLILILGGVYFFVYSSFFKITDVIVEGTKTINPDEIKVILENYRAQEDNLFKFPVEKVENEITNKFLLVDKVNVTRGVPKTIKVEISEREGFLVWQAQGKNYLIDKKGIAFKETTDTFSLPVVVDEQNKDVKLGDKILTKNFVKFISEVNSNLEKKTRTKIKKIFVRESTFELDVLTYEGWRVIFDTTQDSEKQILVMAKTLPRFGKKIKEYLDLRIQDWAYYK
jgi:cell division septal protein FtsQ